MGTSEKPPPLVPKDNVHHASDREVASGLLHKQHTNRMLEITIPAPKQLVSKKIPIEVQK